MKLTLSNWGKSTDYGCLVISISKLSRSIVRLNLLLIVLIFCNALLARTYTLFTHYSEKDGLSEINVTSMIQDSKGLMWFGTYDGLNMFNGYNFKTYKSNPGGEEGLRDFRVDQIQEGSKGHLWLLTYDGCVYQFNQQTERFLKLPQSLDLYKSYKPKFDNIYVSRSGYVWLRSKNDGCFQIQPSIQDKDIQVTHYDERSGLLSSNQINKIYSDADNNTWVLTNDGLNLIKSNNGTPLQLFKEKNEDGFYSIYEYGNRLWIGGDHGKVRLYNKNKRNFEVISFPSLSAVIDIIQYSSDEVFVLTKQDGFYIYSISSKRIQAFNKSSGCGLVDNNLYSCYLDKSSNIWIESESSSVVYFQTASRKVTSLNILKNRNKEKIPVRFFVKEDKFGNIWVHPRYGGLSQYNKVLNRLEQPDGLANVVGQKFSDVVHSAYSDRQGNLWLSPYSHEIEEIVFVNSPFSFHHPESNNFANSLNEIRTLMQDDQQRIWAGSKNGLLYVFDSNHNKLGYLCENGMVGSGVPFKAACYSMLQDKYKNIWLGTKGSGLIKLMTNGSGRYRIQEFRYKSDDVYSLSNDNVYSILQDRFNRIWVATYGGGINLIDEKNSTIRFLSNRNVLNNYPMESCSRVRYLVEDKRGYMYVGTTGGMLVFNNYGDVENVQFKHIMFNPGDPNSISGNDVHYILPASDGKLYLAIFGGGLNVLDKPFDLKGDNHFKSYMMGNGTPSNIFYTLKEDKRKNIWFSTETSIGKFVPSKEIFETYRPLNERSYIFMEGAVMMTGSGELAYGTSDGYLTFSIVKPLKNNYVPQIIFTDLQLFNKSVEVGVNGSPLDKIIDDTPELVLSHKQNVFSISFTALDYSNQSNIQYAYMLEGFDNDWNYVHGQHVATYTNLPKGKYRFKVRSTNSDGNWVNNERSLEIIREPSFWESFWGYLFYLVTGLFLFGLVAYVLYKFFILRTNVEIEHKMTNMKLQFFTDISHELRTPLTLIASPVENVLRTEPLSDIAVKQLTVVQKNVDRMLRLVTQILDFRKVQNQKMKLLIEPLPFATLIFEITQNFIAESENKKIQFEVKNDASEAVLWADKDKIEKIFYNLFSNALKFSQSNSTIEVRIIETNLAIIVSVKDQGVGIDADRIKLLFNRFESFVNPMVGSSQGTGIGLSLTKELVELHHGEIKVESEPGKGSTFTVKFLKGKDHFLDMQDQDMEITATTNHDDESDKSDISIDMTEEVLLLNEKQQILIVEDNVDLREFLSMILSAKYQVLEAENGKVALDMLQNELPDIVITDVMMPEMSGLELVKLMKDDIRTSHIPVILLTARTDMDVKLEALQYGVDDYITKPFSSAYLEARVDNILKLRQQLQDLYRTSLTSGTQYSSNLKPGSKDELFIQRIIQFMDENIGDSELTIEDIASHLALGRSTFFKKLKSMIGISPVEFLRDYRIQRAAQLIASGENNFSEIATMVGFNDSSYFSRCFKQKFGISPREYKDNCIQS